MRSNISRLSVVLAALMLTGTVAFAIVINLSVSKLATLSPDRTVATVSGSVQCTLGEFAVVFAMISQSGDTSQPPGEPPQPPGEPPQPPGGTRTLGFGSVLVACTGESQPVVIPVAVTSETLFDPGPAFVSLSAVAGNKAAQDFWSLNTSIVLVEVIPPG